VLSTRDIESWAADSPKLLRFRKAMQAMQDISDEALLDEPRLAPALPARHRAQAARADRALR
jgi:hypothetical protein